jgi:hypothetical protein
MCVCCLCVGVGVGQRAAAQATLKQRPSRVASNLIGATITRAHLAMIEAQIRAVAFLAVCPHAWECKLTLHWRRERSL